MSDEQQAAGGVWDAMQTFLDRKGQNSKNTKDTYERALRIFFLDTRGKKLEDLTPSDLVFSMHEVEKYQVKLRKKHKESTVNTKLKAVRSCYKKLSSYGFPVDPEWFSVEHYKLTDKKGSEPMSHAEVLASLQVVSRTYKAKQKMLLIRLAYATAFRLETLLELKRSDFSNMDGVWVVKVLGKGQKWDVKKITNDLYEEVLEQFKQSKNDKLFTFTDKTITDMMKKIKSEIDFGDRTISFHSFKKSSIEEVRIITNNDLYAMKEHANHSSPQTTIADYANRRRIDELVVVDIDYHVPVEAFDHLTHEQLLDLVKSADRNTQIKLLQKMGII